MHIHNGNILDDVVDDFFDIEDGGEQQEGEPEDGGGDGEYAATKGGGDAHDHHAEHGDAVELKHRAIGPAGI